MDSDYPYPQIDKDGYEFTIIEQDDVEEYPFPLPDFPSDKERFEVKEKDTVKLIFQYNETYEVDGRKYNSERMWVEVTKTGGAYIEGRLDSIPKMDSIVHEDQIVRFHPKHIVQFWKG